MTGGVCFWLGSCLYTRPESADYDVCSRGDQPTEPVSILVALSVLVAQLVERPPGLPMCSQKESLTKFETRWHQEIPFSKELTDNYCALGLLFESTTCNNNNLLEFKLAYLNLRKSWNSILLTLRPFRRTFGTGWGWNCLGRDSECF